MHKDAIATALASAMSSNAPLTEQQAISREVLQEKYLKAGEVGDDDVYRRVARSLASAEAPELRDTSIQP